MGGSGARVFGGGWHIYFVVRRDAEQHSGRVCVCMRAYVCTCAPFGLLDCVWVPGNRAFVFVFVAFVFVFVFVFVVMFVLVLVLSPQQIILKNFALYLAINLLLKHVWVCILEGTSLGMLPKKCINILRGDVAGGKN